MKNTELMALTVILVVTLGGCITTADDFDQDGLSDEFDSCPNIQGPRENHGCPICCSYEDFLDDVCDMTDTDADGICDGIDNCPCLSNSDQADADEDGVGDGCDLTPSRVATQSKRKKAR